MIDPELEAIHKCTELLKDLEEEAKIRVVKYLVDRYKLSATPNTLQAPVPSHQQFGNHQLTSGTVIHDEPAAKAVFNGSHPSMRDIIAKDLPKSEIEWVLIYCFYSSNFGEKDFTREEIIDLYETSKRKTKQVLANLSLNITSAIKKDWIKSINDKDFIILDAGKHYAYDILNGNSSTKARKVVKRKSKDKAESSSK